MEAYSTFPLTYLLVFVLSVGTASTVGPNIPQNWQAEIAVYSELGNLSTGSVQIANWTGPVVNSFTNKYFVFNTSKTTWYTVPPLSLLNTTIIGNGNDGWYVRNGLCSSISTIKYKSFFQWMQTPLLTYEGKQNVTIFPLQPPVYCDIWRVQFIAPPPLHFNSTIDLCINGNTPVGQSFVVYSKEDYSIFKMAFSNFTAIANPPSLVLPSSCSSDPYFCPTMPGEQDNVTMTLYRYHPSNDWDLADHNLADLAGEAAYICYSLLQEPQGDNGDSLISASLLQMNSTWGVYAHCNDGDCFPSLPHGVGREAVEGIGYFSGQCSSNSQIGSWYSLESHSECPEGEPFGNGGCAWQEMALLKTVNISCLLSHGMMATCSKDKQVFGGVPFPYSSELLYKAFASSDVQFGGCPAVPPGTSA